MFKTHLLRWHFLVEENLRRSGDSGSGRIIVFIQLGYSMLFAVPDTDERETVEPAEGRSYGLTWRDYGSFERKALDAIKSCAATPVVRVADLGAGHGFFTKKVLEHTPAHITAFEIVPSAAGKVISNAKLARLPKGSIPLKDRVRVLRGDWISGAEKAGKFDVVWSAQHMHFCRPMDIPVYMSTLWNVLNPGGLVYLLVHFPSGNSDAMRIYDEAKQGGAQFPGYFILHEGRGGSPIEALSENSLLLPGERHFGVYGRAPTQDACHHAKHFFDHDVLAREFTKSGFEVVEQSVVDLYNGRKELPVEALLDPKMRMECMLVGVVARKCG